MTFPFTTPGFAIGVLPKLKPVTPAVRTPLTFLPGLTGGRPRLVPFGATVPPLQNTPGARLGSAPAPLASPTLGAVVSPAIALTAAVAGARAAYLAGKQ
jgi:hypothetical protein